MPGQEFTVQGLDKGFGFAIALITLGTLVDLVYVPITYGILKGLRKALNIKYLV